MTVKYIDFSDEKPLYAQVVEAIKQKISNNYWTLGMMISSENELAKEFDVSVGTIKKALSVLVQEGILYRRQGRGTFVASPDFSKSFSRFFRYGQFKGEESEVPGSQFLSAEVIQAPTEIAAALQLVAGEDILFMKRVRTLQEIPFCVEEIYLPYSRFKGLENLDLGKKLLYPIYNQNFSTPIFWAEEFLQPDTATGEIADLLNIPRNSPVMCVERIAYTYEDIPVEWRRSVGRGDSFRYHIVIR